MGDRWQAWGELKAQAGRGGEKGVGWGVERRVERSGVEGEQGHLRGGEGRGGEAIVPGELKTEAGRGEVREVDGGYRGGRRGAKWRESGDTEGRRWKARRRESRALVGRAGEGSYLVGKGELVEVTHAAQLCHDKLSARTSTGE